MLRRKPTAIKLTADDVALYEEFKKAKDAAGKSGNNNNPHDAKAPTNTTLDTKMRQKTREERMGVGSRQ